ncbi:Uncharacterized protein Rs2_20871 [Raphanus sativus]|nr:Uncharacterized protein Rs2_20871 [Raphanus sativus]
MPGGINMSICAEGPGLQIFSRRRATPRGSTGLFIYKVKKFYDHWRWNDVGGSKRKRGGDNRLGKKKKLSGNDECSVTVAESTGFLDDNYVRRVHRDYKNFGDELAVLWCTTVGSLESALASITWTEDQMIIAGMIG